MDICKEKELFEIAKKEAVHRMKLLKLPLHMIKTFWETGEQLYFVDEDNKHYTLPQEDLDTVKAVEKRDNCMIYSAFRKNGVIYVRGIKLPDSSMLIEDYKKKLESERECDIETTKNILKRIS